MPALRGQRAPIRTDPRTVRTSGPDSPLPNMATESRASPWLGCCLSSYQRRYLQAWSGPCLGRRLGYSSVSRSHGHLLVKALAQPTRPESFLHTQYPFLWPAPASRRGTRGWPGPLTGCLRVPFSCLHCFPASGRWGGKDGWGWTGSPFSGVAVMEVPSAKRLEDGWADQTNCPLVTPDPFSRFTFSIHKGLKTMDFHFACCTYNLPKHPLGAGCQQAAARPAR